MAPEHSVAAWQATTYAGFQKYAAAHAGSWMYSMTVSGCRTYLVKVSGYQLAILRLVDAYVTGGYLAGPGDELLQMMAQEAAAIQIDAADQEPEQVHMCAI
jgi:hypothetical protein